MFDAAYLFYRSALKQFPYVPGPEAEHAAKVLEQATARIADVPEDLRTLLLDLVDSVESLAHDRGRYGFLLGLDAGLSLARESVNLQEEW